MTHRNSYDDAVRASAYAKLEFPGTYYLAYRDMPAIIRTHVRGARALDFGCGAGRSTRFLRGLGLDVVGIDAAKDMIENARALDPGGDYRLTGGGEGGPGDGVLPGSFDLVFSGFTFDNVPRQVKPALLRRIADLLAARGVFINLVSTPDMYVNEWVSCSTKDYPENRNAASGDRVRIVITEIADRRPVEDIVCSPTEYRRLYRRAGLEVALRHEPLATGREPWQWVNETRIAPWAIYVLRRKLA